MNKKGFTLIELLAVIVILALLALLASTAITKLVKGSKEDLSEMQEGLIKEAAYAWGTANLDKLPEEGRCSYLNLSDLKEYGILPESIVDSMTNEEISDDLKIKISAQIGEFGNAVITYEVNPESVDGCRWINTAVCQDSQQLSKPDLYNGTLTPVIYDKNYDNGEGKDKGAWLIANPSSKWYSYCDQEWANAVILSNSARLTKKAGDPVSVDVNDNEVLAMFVWIPRYSYTISSTAGTDKTAPEAIDIKFVSKNIKETGTASYTGDTASNYFTHPAFTFGDKELSGIWVGKFEISYTDNRSESLGCTNDTCANANGIRILPNKTTLKSNIVSSFFYAIRSMSMAGNPFGINSGITDSHMIKNSEWGAVAYLSQSIYGKYGNSDYEGTNKEVKINSCSAFITGVATCEDTYETKTGQAASTTGNITGIYDMSGGSFEYVMGYLTTSYGSLPWGSTSTSNKAGFTSILLPKYFDEYTVTSNADCKDENGNTILECRGHALSETSEWYGDSSSFVSATSPWFSRGGSRSNGSSGGVFRYGYGSGGAGDSDSSRAVLVSGG